jgi:hypothetical protein
MSASASGALPPGEVELPAGQWIATGRVAAVSGTRDRYVGQMDVRAWFFDPKYRNPGSLDTQGNDNFVREVTSAGSAPGPVILGANSATIRWTPTRAVSVVFGPDTVPCEPKAGARQGTEVDTYVFATVPQIHGSAVTDSVRETASLSGCGSTVGTWTIDWKARSVLVALPVALRTVAPNPDNAASTGDFRSAAAQVCAATKKRVAQIAKATGADIDVLRDAKPPSAAAEHAASDLAALFAKLPQVAIANFRNPPQPPAGPLDTLWLSYVNREVKDLTGQWLFRSALIDQMDAYAVYEHTANTTALQRMLAWETVANADTNPLNSQRQPLKTLQQRLDLPTSCRTLPLDS